MIHEFCQPWIEIKMERWSRDSYEAAEKDERGRKIEI